MRFRKILCVLILFIIILSGCELEGEVKLPDLEGMNRAQITRKLDRFHLNYAFKIKPQVYYNDSEFDKFVEYGSGLKAGDIISRDYYLYVYTTALPLTVNRLSEITVPDFEGKSYVLDGIGLVTLARTVDGDTAHFYDSVTKEDLYVRFLGINTPEIYSSVQPWGRAAADYTANRLRNAKQIVLEAEGSKTDTHGRYLAFVWVDGVLLNLELVQQAYTDHCLSKSSKYFWIFSEVVNEVMKTGRRYWGELDPNYRY